MPAFSGPARGLCRARAEPLPGLPQPTVTHGRLIRSLLAIHNEPPVLSGEPLMTKGTITHFDPRRGTGFVRHHHAESGIPFSVRHAQDRQFAHGDAVEFTVRGGLAGVAAPGVRRVRATT